MILRCADLFCGAGGSSTGLRQVADAMGVGLDLTAVNHWRTAVETHAANHPDARHICESLDSIDPRKVTGGKLDLLWASPECTHHSVALGGKPINDQSRATAWCVTRWADALRPKFIIVENVPEFQTWGPLGANNRPLKSRKGEVFFAWAQSLVALGYRVEWRVLNAADYGAATSRRRLFVVARLDGGARGRGPIVWPTPTHQQHKTADLFGSYQPWRGAREIIDWSQRGQSIAGRQKPLVPKTVRVIELGHQRFGGIPFLVAFYGSGSGLVPQSIHRPLPAITTKDRFGLVQPGADMTFRMLQAHELSSAMGFPKTYKFAGTKTEAVRQIGNAVVVEQAAALWANPIASVSGIRKVA